MTGRKVKVIKKDEINKRSKDETVKSGVCHPVDNIKQINRKIEQNLTNWIIDAQIKKNASLMQARNSFFGQLQGV